MSDLATDEDLPAGGAEGRDSSGGDGNDAMPPNESERTADRLAESEAAAVSAKVTDALKSHLISRHGIDAGDAELLLTATDPDLLLKQVDRLLAQRDERAYSHIVPNEGKSPPPRPAPDATREFVRDLFGNPD